MTSYFEFENLIDRIYNPITKENFSEVLRSYNNGNYRSAVVMLWSVIISDLLLKLVELEEIYEDKTAQKILEEIKNYQDENPKSPAWELMLLEKVYDRMDYLSENELSDLKYIQTKRHQCAHPIHTQNYKLLKPNKVTTRALMINSLEAILLKPIYPSTGVVSLFVEDIGRTNGYFESNQKFEKYLNTKYFSRYPNQLIVKIFRALWKFVFRLDDEECSIFREVNFDALRIIYARYKSECQDIIKEEKEYFNKLEDEYFIYFIQFIEEHQDIIPLLTESNLELLKNYINTYPEAKFLSWFFEDSYQAHINLLIDFVKEMKNVEVNNYVIEILHQRGIENEEVESFNNLMITLYGISPLFKYADTRFQNFILPYLANFSKTNLLALLELIEDNDQTYRRWGAESDHRLIFEKCKVVIGKDFEIERFPNFKSSLGLKTIIPPSILIEDDDLPF